VANNQHQKFNLLGT